MLEKRIRLSSGAPWESIVGYSRVVRVGNIIEVAGTTAMDGNEVVFPYEPYNQTQYILLKIQQALEDVGAGMKDIVRTRIYVTDIENWEEIGRAHGEVFADIRPAMSMLEVSSLIKDELVVEIEATAIIADDE